MRILGVVHRGNLRTLLLVAGALVAQPTAASITAGSLLVLAGAALHVYAKGSLTRNRALSTGGPYRFSRNPFYLANFLVDGGLCSIANRPAFALIALSFWAVIYGAAILREERTLEALFGDAWHRYAERVPRFFPWRRPLPRAQSGAGFSFANRNLTHGSEYARFVRMLAAPLWIVLPRAAWEAAERGFAGAEPVLAGFALLASLLILDSALGRAARTRVTAAP